MRAGRAAREGTFRLARDVRTMRRKQKRFQFGIAHFLLILLVLSLLFGLLSLGGYALLALPFVLLLGSLALGAMLDIRRAVHPADRAVSIVYCAAVLFLLMLLIGGVRNLMLGST